MTSREDPTGEHAVTDWEVSLRAAFGSTSHRVVVFSAKNLPQLAEALGIAGDAHLDTLAGRVRHSLASLDRERAEDRRYNEFRARVAAACAWWGITEINPTPDQLTAYVAIANLRTRRKLDVDLSRRSFRHAWAGHTYRQRRDGQLATPALEANDYETGRRDPFKTDCQDALVAFLMALIDDGDGIEHWDHISNSLARDGYHPLVLAPEYAGTPRGAAQIADLHAVADDSPWRTIDLDPGRTKNFRVAQGFAGWLLWTGLEPVLERGEQLMDEAGFGSFSTFESLSDRYRVLFSLRSILDQFSPQLFDRPLGQFVRAHAPRGSNTRLSQAERRSLRKQALEWVRPGVHIPNMYESLMAAQQIQARLLPLRGKLPTVAASLRSSWDEWLKAEECVTLLDRVLGLEGDARLGRRQLDAMRRALESLATETHYVRQLVELSHLRDELAGFGVRKLLQQETGTRSRDDPNRDERLIELELARRWDDAIAANPAEAVWLVSAGREDLSSIDRAVELAPTIMGVILESSS